MLVDFVEDLVIVVEKAVVFAMTVVLFVDLAVEELNVVGCVIGSVEPMVEYVLGCKGPVVGIKVEDVLEAVWDVVGEVVGLDVDVGDSVVTEIVKLLNASRSS